MPQRRLYGWTPGIPIDGMRLRLYKDSFLAGTLELNYDATEKVVDVEADSNYRATLHSFRELQESHFFLEVEFTTVESGSGRKPQSYLRGQVSAEVSQSSEGVPPPTGEILVENVN